MCAPEEGDRVSLVDDRLPGNTVSSVSSLLA